MKHKIAETIEKPWQNSFIGGELLPWKGVWFVVRSVRDKGLILEFKEKIAKKVKKATSGLL